MRLGGDKSGELKAICEAGGGDLRFDLRSQDPLADQEKFELWVLTARDSGSGD